MNKKNIQKLHKVFSFILYVALFYSCTAHKSQTEKKMIGFWTIDIDSCSVSSGFWDYRTSNAIAVRSDHNCKLPGFLNLEKEDSNGKWNLVGVDSIYFNAPKNPLHGKYKIQFYREYKDRLFKMRLINDERVIVCRKGLQNFERDNPDW